MPKAKKKVKPMGAEVGKKKVTKRRATRVEPNSFLQNVMVGAKKIFSPK